MKPRQFEIWMTDLEPHYGSEQGGKRPVVVFETNGVKGKGSTTVVVPLTSVVAKVYSYDVIVDSSKISGLKRESKLMFRQIRVIDKDRLKKKMGRLEKKYWDMCRVRLSLLFDLSGDYI
jgi:mRNA interferase MazF